MQLVTYIFLTAIAAWEVVNGYSTEDTGDGMLYKLKVTGDVTLEDSRNMNSLQYLLVARHPQYPMKRFLVKFEDLPSSCKANNIKWAKMYLYFVYAHKASWHTPKRTPDIDRPLTVHLVKKSWTESGATRTIRMKWGWGMTWRKPYLAIDNTDAESRYQDKVIMHAGRPSGFKEFDVTRAVKQWHSKQSSNYGLLVRAENEATNGRDLRFYSNAYSDAKKHAYINVLCSKPKYRPPLCRLGFFKFRPECI